MREQLRDESIDLIMTSPPFGLVRKKDYGNEDADRYVVWFEQFADQFNRILKPRGSLVIDIGAAWKKGFPTKSLYQYELLIMLCRKYDFMLAQDFFWWNPAKLPTPAEWVNIRRIRVKDAVNCIWWLSKSPFPRVNMKRVLQPYSSSMRKLLQNGYQPKLRPSGHKISSKFQRDNMGAIPPNLIALANTESNSAYQRYCRLHHLPEHPARFPSGLPAFFIRMLTNRGDLVVDPFAGSCVTGAVAEEMGRRWICYELDHAYIEGSRGRFLNDTNGGQKKARTKPYEIYPPSIHLLDKSSLPLIEDGGERRLKSPNRG
jgi:site-specific DNA-methyltransferase (cytosine-N4-specific)